MSKMSPERKAFENAKARCNPRTTHLVYQKYYVARGIKFLFKSFEQFLKEMGKRPSTKHSLDRINNDSHYKPGNVRWATLKQQHRNVRPNSLEARRTQSIAQRKRFKKKGSRPSSQALRHRRRRERRIYGS